MESKPLSPEAAQRLPAIQYVEKPRGFFNVLEEKLREPEILRNFRAAR
jgi:hypothetical protein